MHDPPRDQEHHEQHDQAVDEAGLAEHVEAEEPEHWLHDDALQAVEATGDVGEAVGKFAEQQRDAEGHHQPREVRAAHDQERGDEADEHRRQASDQQGQHRFIHIVMQREQAGRIGADTEECGVPERDDAGVTQDQVEREHEQRQPGDLGEDQVAVRKQQDRRQRHRPEQHLAPAPARQVVEVCSDAGSFAPGHVSVSPFCRTDRSGAGSGSRSSWCR